MNKNEIDNLKTLFIDILETACQNRFKVKHFINYLETQTDFFKAPASTRFHLAEAGGLLKHSLHVYKTLITLAPIYAPEIPQDSLAICGLLHDICKSNFYKQEFRNVKTPNGWQEQLTYVVNDDFPIGHGEKSVIMLQQHMTLTKDEIIAIRWHMNGFDYAVKGGEQAYSNAVNKCKLLRLLGVSDLIASRLLEGAF